MPTVLKPIICPADVDGRQCGQRLEELVQAHGTYRAGETVRIHCPNCQQWILVTVPAWCPELVPVNATAIPEPT